MEADWEFEVGGDAPVIEAAWAGYIDLRHEPERALELNETTHFSALAEALIRLNQSGSPVWTSKCDLWPSLEASEFDPDELDAVAGCFACAMGCYIDLLPRVNRQWLIPDAAAAECTALCRLLRALPLRCCRVDLVIRRAFVTSDALNEEPQLGLTAYLISCGESSADAERMLGAALFALVGAFVARRS